MPATLTPGLLVGATCHISLAMLLGKAPLGPSQCSGSPSHWARLAGRLTVQPDVGFLTSQLAACNSSSPKTGF